MAAGNPVKLEDARHIVLEAARRLPVERVSVADALGRVLAEDAVARESVPPFDNSAMDGFAVRSEDVRDAGPGASVRLRIVGESRAGAPASAVLGSGEAITISTGAALPQGADSVIRLEEARAEDHHVDILATASPGNQVRRAGEDVEPGRAVLRAGTTLGPAELGVLASLDCGAVACGRRPRVSILVTGDELLAPGDPARPGAVRDSSSYSVPALVRCAGAEVLRLATASDQAAEMEEAVAATLDGADVAVICGGVSVGRHDHVKQALRAAGTQQAFWGIALKPGRPTWFGSSGETLVFGLPGNPVSAMVTCALLVAPALRALAGELRQASSLTAAIDDRYEKRPGRTHAVPCRLRAAGDDLHAHLAPRPGSHLLTSMLAADGLAMIPAELDVLPAGERVQIEPLPRPAGLARTVG